MNNIIYLISHDNTNTGAPIFLYNLNSYLNNHNCTTKFIIKYDNTPESYIKNRYYIDTEHILEFILNDCFDWESYINEYPDIYKVCKTNKQKIIQHVINHGLSEKRNIKYNIQPIVICNTIDTYQYVNILHPLNIYLYWILHEWIENNNYTRELYNKMPIGTFNKVTKVIFPC